MNISTKLPSALSDSQEAIVPRKLFLELKLRKLFSELKLSWRKTVDLVQEGEGPDGTTNPFDHQNRKRMALQKYDFESIEVVFASDTPPRCVTKEPDMNGSLHRGQPTLFSWSVAWRAAHAAAPSCLLSWVMFSPRPTTVLLLCFAPSHLGVILRQCLRIIS